MKRHGDLYRQICSEENIYKAYRNARRCKPKLHGVLRFEKDAPGNLARVRDLLVTKRFHTSKYTVHTIYEPKERKIYALPFAPDRVAQHALINVVSKIWVPLFIKDSYACIAGRGIHSGSRRTMEYVRAKKYCLQCDISKFYPSIRHDVLKAVIRRKIKCPDTLWLLDDIIDSFPGETNVPIGNLTSQWFGNLYMNELDQFAKHELGIRCYVRYCDDFLAFSDDKAQVHEWGKRLEAFCNEKLRLRLSKREVFPVSQGVDFLGYRHFRDYVLLRKATAKRVKKRLSLLGGLFSRGLETAGHFRSVLASAQGWLKWCSCRNISEFLGVDDYVAATGI